MLVQKSETEHTLGRDEAISRIQAYTRFIEDYSDLKGSWEGSTYTFSITVQGVPVRATIQVEEDRLKLEREAPSYAPMFANWPSHMAQTALQAPGGVPETDGEAPAGPPPDPGSAPAVLFLHHPKAGGMLSLIHISEPTRPY